MYLKYERARVVSAVICGCIAFGLVRAQEPTLLKSEEELILALSSTPRSADSTDKLLDLNRQLVTNKLWRRLMDLAIQAYSENPQQSFVLYDSARMVAERLSDFRLLGRTYYNIARSYSGLRKFDEAKRAYVDSERAFIASGLERDRIYILADLGTISLIQERYTEAKAYSDESIQLADKLKNSSVGKGAWPDSFGVANALGTLAELSAREGNLPQAIEQWMRSVALYEDLNRLTPSYDYYLADAYAGLGRAYTAAGDNRNALVQLNNALKLAKGAEVPNILNSIGFLYMEQENYEQATAHYSRSLKLYREDNNRWEAARVLLNLGVIEQRQDNIERALQLFRESLSEAKSVKHQDVVIAALEGIGLMLSEQKLFQPALQSLGEALEVAQQIGDRARRAEILWRQAEAHLTMGDYAEAVSLSSSARNLAQESHLPKLSYLSAATLGLAYDKQNKLDLAIEILTAVIDEVERSRIMVAGTEEQVGLFFEQRLVAYHKLIELLLKQGKPIESLLYAERAKARVLLDVVGSTRIDLASVLTVNERQQQKLLNERIFDLNERIKNVAPNEDARNSFLTELDQARLDYEAFQDSIYVRHPDLRIRSGHTTPLKAPDVKDLTESDTAYLEYVVTKDEVLLFVTTTDSTHATINTKAYPIEIGPLELREKVNLFHDRLANRHPDYANLAHELYVLLISPAEKQLKKNLCIVPDSFLWNLPFQAMMSSNDQFLLEAHALYYAPSLSVLRELKANRRSNRSAPGNLIAFGNPVIGKNEKRNEEFCPLPEAETEENSIARSFSPTERRVLIGREATEKSFRTLAPAYSTIHLATHGVIDNRQPLYSHLLLTKTEGDVEDDGLLEAREIMNMDLRADLAVLSACETANGRIREGEGVVGMSWAFFVGGTRSMLVSQWKVNSASTSQLMIGFYEALESANKLSTSKKAAALQRAALKLLKGRQYRHPFYWTSFVLIGDSR
jgi:CHAT domain-containing protein/Tfp pilus assembly protein PilF